jgi:RNA polymerase-interacting CarD/CdnL/TRCF family regulator
MSHELMTHMLFVDAIVGVGVRAHIADHAVKGGLATFTGNQHNEHWEWNRTALEELDLPTLQDLYTGLKLHEVTYAS